MFSSTIHYKQRVQRFLQDSNRLSPFNPLDCFAIHFATILIWFLCVSGFGSISGLLFPHWQGFFIGRRSGRKVWTRACFDLELATPPYVAPITAISHLPKYRLYCMHKIVRWPCGKVICHSQKYARDHWVMQRKALWLYAIILYSPIVC